MKATRKISFVFLTMVIFFSGCFSEKQALAPLGDGKEKIKVLYYTERQFNEDYGQLFKVKYPNIEVEVIPIMAKNYPLNFDGVEEEDEKKIKKMIEQHNPDVLLLNEHLLTAYEQEGKLYSLEEVIVQDQFDLTGYMPGLIDRLRTKGMGTLYALIPSLKAEVLFYNRDLFTANNIEFPRNQMTWEDFFALCRRFQSVGTEKNKVFGFALGSMSMDIEYSYSRMLKTVATTFAVPMFDTTAKKLLIHSDSWKKIFELTTDAIRSQVVYIPKIDNKNIKIIKHPGNGIEIIRNPQVQIPDMYNRTVAMNVAFAGAVDELNQANINWDIVTVPIDPQNPDESTQVKFGEMYAVAANSSHKRAAWEFLKFVNGTDMAKILSRSKNKPLPTRKQVVKDFYGRSVEPFYKLKPRADSSDILFHKNVPRQFYRLFTPLLEHTLTAIVDKKKTVDEALAELQVKGQQALEQVQAAKKQDKNTSEVKK